MHVRTDDVSVGAESQHLKAQGLWIESPTLEQVNKMYEDSIGVVGIPEMTPKGHKRRLEQIRWTTVVREVLQRREDEQPATEVPAPE